VETALSGHSPLDTRRLALYEMRKP
jgi:hypothetical protein